MIQTIEEARTYRRLWMKNFLVGVGVGAVVGLLVAPRNGGRSQSRVVEAVRSLRHRLQGIRMPVKTQGVTEENEGDVWELVRQQQMGPEHEVAEEAERESEALAEVLNTANKEELMSVKGIGPATAKRIIKHRPYESEEEVLQEGVMPEQVLERVKEELVEKRR